MRSRFSIVACVELACAAAWVLVSVASAASDSPVGWVAEAAAANFEERFADAESLAALAIDALSAQPDANARVVAGAHLALARSLVFRRLVADSRAADAASSALAALEPLPADADSLRAEAHFLLAQFHHDANRPSESLEHAEPAVALLRTTDRDSEMLAASLRLFAHGHERVADTGTALQAYRDALAMRRRLDLPRDRAIGTLHSDLARLAERSGDDEQARLELAEGMREVTTRFGPDDPSMIPLLQRAASFEFQTGDFSRSVDFSRRAIRIAESAAGFDPMNTQILKSQLAQTLIELGDCGASAEILSATAAVVEERLGLSHPRSTHVRFLLSHALQCVGDTTGALAEISRLRAIIDDDDERDHSASLSELLMLEAVLVEVPFPDSARALVERSERIEASRPYPRTMSTVNSTAATLRIAARERDWKAYDRAEQNLQRALADESVAGTPFHTWALGLWADSAFRRGRVLEAFSRGLESSRVSRELLLRNLRTLPDREGLRFAGDRSTALESFLGIVAGAPPDSAPSAWNELIAWRGLVMQEITSRRRPPGDDEAAARAHHEWIRARGLVARAEVRSAGAGNEEAAELDRLRAEAADAEREWARRAARDARHGTEAADLDAIRGALGAHDALVGFAMSSAKDDPARVLAFVTRGSKPRTGPPVRIVDLGDAAELARVVEDWARNTTRSPRGDPDAIVETERTGLRVREHVWDPLLDAIGDARRVYLVPDGPIHRVAWASLPMDDGSFLIEREPAIHVLDAEQDVLRQRATETPDRPLALGGIDFDHAPPPSLASATLLRSQDCEGVDVRFAPLPGTADEALTIAHAFENASVLTGSDATEAAFKAAAPGHTILHLATHGFSLGDCDAAPGTRGLGGVAPIRRERTIDEPSPWVGRRTLLALAGANQARDHLADENEGWLTAEEVSTLDLQGTEWVVLSACRSGVGEWWGPEGALGMRRAFRLAGAASVIASGWDVDDDATREWMTALYDARARGERNASVAAATASRTVLAARRASSRSTHPFYWAAFTPTGE